jgi:flagellar protein FliL
MAEKKNDSAPPVGDAPSAPSAPAKGGLKVLLPALLAIVLAPAATFAVAHFLVLPRFEAGLRAAIDGTDDVTAHASAPATKPAAASGHGSAKGSGKAGSAKDAPVEAANSYRFDNVVVNLAGTMGTRYLKVGFLVTGEKPDVAARFEAERPRLGDVTLAVLSSLTLSDLEEAGSKNLIRERLVSAYNQALGTQVVDSLYFSEFVVQ